MPNAPPSQSLYEVGAVITPISQRRTWRHRGVESLAQGSDIGEGGTQNGPLSADRDPGPQDLIPAPCLGSAEGGCEGGSRLCWEGCEVDQEPVGSGPSPIKWPTNIKTEVATGNGSLVVGVRADFSGVVFPPVCGCKRC